MDEHSIVHRDNSLPTAPVDRDIVILSIATDSYIALDHIGRRIWDLLETPRRVGDLIEMLRTEFEATAEAMTADVVGFLTELQTEGMISVADARPA